MKLLVTGGAGFIGTNFIKYWLEEHNKDRIVSVDSLTYAANKHEYFTMDEQNARLTSFVGDICSPVVEKFVDECDCIVHFAAESHVDNSIADSSPFIQTNIVGTHNLLEFARKYDKRFHHVSTDEVFGSLPLEYDLFTEDTPYDPRSPYSASKASSDHLVRSYFHTHGLKATISNCSNNYGPWQHKEKFLPTIIRSISKDEKIPVYGDGKNVRDWIYVTDHCRAIDSIIHKGELGETYLVGGEEMSNINLVKNILTSMGKDDSLIEYVKDRAGHDRRYAVDCSKITVKLGWKPIVGLDDGLNTTIEWYTNDRV